MNCAGCTEEIQFSIATRFARLILPLPTVYRETKVSYLPYD
jgi:hypothetical protein